MNKATRNLKRHYHRHWRDLPCDRGLKMFMSEMADCCLNVPFPGAEYAADQWLQRKRGAA